MTKIISLNMNKIIAKSNTYQKAFKRFRSSVKSILFDGNHRRQTRNQLQKTVIRELTSDQYPKLSRQQVSWYLRYNEFSSGDLNDGVVKSYMTNQLAANNPIEDRAAEVRLHIDPDASTNKYIFGVIDGHGGPACAQVVSERLFSYIAVMLSPLSFLKGIIVEDIDPCVGLTSRFTRKDYYHSTDMEEMYRVALQKLAHDQLIAPSDECTVEDILKGAFMRLDHDILADAIPKEGSADLINHETLSLAFTGACANIAYIDGTDVYVANTGDCKAIIGQHIDDETWMPVFLSNEHDANNDDELDRIYGRHPGEKQTVIKNSRLLGDLAPLRAFGDARYKWPARIMKHVLNVCNPNVISVYGENLIPQNYQSPPYLTAEPDVMHYSLTPRDKFMVIASDGLWENLGPQQVIDLVAAHMDERQILTEFVLPRENATLREINDILKIRKRKLAKKPEDENVATHLLRMALGPNHTILSQHLTLPENLVRHYRDDITITVVYFDTDFVAKKTT
ncbi:pyruvate dehydrogenase [acetyl-transferring]-phosphatase 1, mitochondrial-like [Mya arenaria]|uniref:pyruvate dehydrogenase [acetyl-transferring]-phosphatase 1, mitochondrial-like n=1 Tax=Mya arenaria TaxID=6604 RepID=UPI0022E62B90|nr:pyruvate dehydrogenase [acetyl-transferring]-phosphatase 1, mitochondrial-like [Mya arenaria]